MAKNIVTISDRAKAAVEAFIIELAGKTGITLSSEDALNSMLCSYTPYQREAYYGVIINSKIVDMIEKHVLRGIEHDLPPIETDDDYPFSAKYV